MYTKYTTDLTAHIDRAKKLGLWYAIHVKKTSAWSRRYGKYVTVTKDVAVTVREP